MPAREGKRELAPEVLRGIGHVVLPILAAVGGLVGFIALAGGAVVWTRFSAAELPPDQIVAVYPRTELVSIASSLLLLFGLVGLLAVGLCFLINPKGRASIGMTRVLLTLMLVEGLAVILLIAEATSWQRRVGAAEAFVFFLFACFAATALFERPEAYEGGDDRHRPLRAKFMRVAVGALGVFFLLFAWAVIRSDARPAIAGAALLCLTPFWLAWRLRDDGEKPPKRRLGRYQVQFSRDGMSWIICLTVAAVIIPGLIMWSGWLLLSLAVAGFLFAALWRAALMPKQSFLWYGVAVFISVPLFGTLTWMVQNVFEPQVQPMALIRKTGDVDEYLQGLYVTETSDRVYFATVATEGCRSDLVAGSGRLLSVPKSEIAAIAIGPLQSIKRARSAALEMSYTLTPTAGIRNGLEDPPGTFEDGGGEGRAHVHRLENVPAAVEPRFGSGLRIVPERAAPGQTVTLRLAAPSEATRGFGRSRHHRTLRVDGVPVAIATEKAQTPWEAEYVRTAAGQRLKLGKQIIFTKSNESYEAISRFDDPERHPLFVRLSDRSVVSVLVYSSRLHRYVNSHTGYVRLRRRKGRPLRLAANHGRIPKVILRDGDEVRLKRSLLRQNWHEDHIKFRMPHGVRSGQVTIDCEPLATPPYLRAREPGAARLDRAHLKKQRE